MTKTKLSLTQSKRLKPNYCFTFKFQLSVVSAKFKIADSTLFDWF